MPGLRERHSGQILRTQKQEQRAAEQLGVVRRVGAGRDPKAA